jgi:hypothetical protein
MMRSGWPYTGRYVSKHRRKRNVTQPENPNPYGEGRCPECGADLNTVDPRKHAVTHWGVDPIQYDPRTARQTLLARQRRAILLGEDVPQA